jgi:hypothetical protein
MPSPYASPQAPLSPDEQFYLNQNPEAGFWSYLGSRGLASVDPVSQYSQRQYNTLYNTYAAGAAANPDEGFYDYLNRASPDLNTQYQMQDQATRGDYSSRNSAGRARWINVA